MIIDTHTHLHHQEFDADRAEVIDRARQAGVLGIVAIGTSRVTSQQAIALAETHADIYAAVGVHPHSASEWSSDDRDWILAAARHPKVRAIGEIGLDYHYNFSERPEQERAFRAQIQLARDVGLPVIIHNREADNDVLAVLRDENAAAVGGILHCWSSGREAANRALDLGFLLGFGGSVTFPKNAELREVVRGLSADCIVLETDCPYLAPVPHRGRRNEPALVRVVAEFISSLRGVTLSDLALSSSANARRLFRLPSPG